MDRENLRKMHADLLMYDRNGSTQTPTKHAPDTSLIIPSEKQTPDNCSSKFDNIAANINKAIGGLNEIYRKIGYSTTETRIKKSEIFSIIEETISSFSSSLLREQNNIENECEWLRQQIRIILAMINDDKGERILRCYDRGIVFNDVTLYEQGYKEDVVDRLESLQSRRQKFYATSPFNLTSPFIPEEEDSPTMENQIDYMTHTIPHLPLLQLKSNLNRIFLDVLQSFMKPFKKLTELNLAFLDMYDTVGNITNSDELTLLKSLPSREESEEHFKLIQDFELAMGKVQQSKQGKESMNDTTQYVVSSPRKVLQRENDSPTRTENDTIEELRDINYKLVRAIRCLRVTKINTELFGKLQKLANFYVTQMSERKDRMSAIISKCLNLITDLQLNEKQLQIIQKNFDASDEMKNNVNTATSEGYFDVETLHFIQENPTEFGLHEGHLNFVEKFFRSLEKLHESKQKKKAYLVSTCSILWERLDESEEFIENFLQSNHDLSESSFINFKLELNRLYVKRSEYVEEFIRKARAEIESLWTKMLFSDDMKREFKYFEYDSTNGGEDKEEVLNGHEEELTTLKKDYEGKKHILQIYSQVQELVKDQQFLVESSKDSSRLLSKNSCKILLNEEKIRKKLIKNMPRLINNLKEEVVKFNNKQLSEGKKPLQAYGEDFFEVVLMLESEHLHKKADKARSQSPSKISPKRAPGSRISPSKNLPSRSPPKSSRPSDPSPKRNGIVKPTRKVTKLTRNNMMNTRLTSAVNSMSSFSDLSNSLESPTMQQPIAHLSGSRNVNSSHSFGLLQPLHSPLRPEESFNSQSTLRFSPLQESNMNNSKAFTEAGKSTLSLSPTRPGISYLSNGKENTKASTENQFSKRHSEISNEGSFTMSDDYQLWRDQRIQQLNSLS